MENNVACFFGHREVTRNIRPKLTAIIEKLITEEDVTEFYVGHQGQFDYMVYSVLKELKTNWNLDLSKTQYFKESFEEAFKWEDNYKE